MKILVNGGVGNQLFQIGNFFLLRRYTKKNCKLDFSEVSSFEVLDLFNLEAKEEILASTVATPKNRISWGFRLLRYLSIRQTIFNRMLHFMGLYLNNNHNWLLSKDDIENARVIWGYFHNLKMAETIREKIVCARQVLPLSWIERIEIEEPIVIHVRLGDYTNNSKIGVLPRAYYEEALRHITNWETSNIWIFSNDLEGAQKVLADLLPSRTTWIGPGNQVLSDIEIILLMSLAPKIVVANSTFSWWAAFLANDMSKVYYPSKWYRQLENPLVFVRKKWVPIEFSWK